MQRVCGGEVRASSESQAGRRRVEWAARPRQCGDARAKDPELRRVALTRKGGAEECNMAGLWSQATDRGCEEPAAASESSESPSAFECSLCRWPRGAPGKARRSLAPYGPGPSGRSGTRSRDPGPLSSEAPVMNPPAIFTG